MEKSKTIVFVHSRDLGEHNKVKEEVEFDINATEEDIQECYQDWVWGIIGDKFTWYEKDKGGV